MSANTKIEWTDATWNPIIGCSRVSEGCRNCYAEKIAGRFGNGKPTVYSGLTQIVNGRAVWTGQIAETKQLLQPLSWKPVRYELDEGGPIIESALRPRRVFVNSMSDLFHENVTDEQRDKIFAVMALCPQHTFQVLTKRPERMLAYFNGAPWGQIEQRIGEIGNSFERNLADVPIESIPLPNVWLGVSVENQATADTRIPLLLRTPAAVRFISAEPLLGEIRLERIRMPEPLFGWHDINVLSGDIYRHARQVGFGHPKLDWVICGGESGPGARHMHPDWARSLRDQCHSAGTPYFFKQWGKWVPTTDPAIAEARGIPLSDCMSYVGKKAAGALLDGVEHKAFPEGM